MALKKVEHPSGKKFYWRCDNPNCPYESKDIEYTAENYHAPPPPVCPSCGRS